MGRAGGLGKTTVDFDVARVIRKPPEPRTVKEQPMLSKPVNSSPELVAI